MLLLSQRCLLFDVFPNYSVCITEKDVRARGTFDLSVEPVTQLRIYSASAVYGAEGQRSV